jgi:tRNA(fMet)-specific endonuclease VapC
VRYILDTSILSDLVRRPQGRVWEHIVRRGEDQVCTSIVVAAELGFGALKSGSERPSTQVDAILGAVDILPLEPPVDTIYGTLRWRLERQGRPIGANDLLIAAQALAHGHTLVTDNEGEFGRIEELPLENRLRP